MIDTKLLKETIESKGVTKKWLAKEIGVSRPRLYKIMEGIDVSISEVERVSNVLGLSPSLRNKIFFAQRVEYKSTPE